MLESVHQRGKIAIILPQGFLYKKVDYRVRRSLIEKNYIDAIIRLPEKLFYNTKISVVIVIIDKAKRENEILFIDASKEYKSKRKTNILTVENQEKIVDIYTNKKEIVGCSYIAKFEEIKKNDFDLNINKYVKTQDKIEDINQEKIKEKIYKLEQEKIEIQKEILNLIEQKLKF